MRYKRRRIADLFRRIPPMNEKLTGSLTITGKDSIDIKLAHFPLSVSVEFDDEGTNVPCDPHKDKVDWSISLAHNKFVLSIKWDVSGTRSITWTISF